MCTVSMVMDHYTEKDYWKKILEDPPTQWPPYIPTFPNDQITKQEFDDLKKEVLEMKALLKRALEYDKRNNEPHCEMEEKVAAVKKIADIVGVDLTEIFENDPK